MIPLIFLVITITLLVAFLVLTSYENAKGVRYLATLRGRADEHADRAVFIFEHVDFVAFIKEEAHRILQRVGHDITHLVLQIVRAVERLLTRIVRHFRSREINGEQPRAGARAFVKTLTDFKDNLKATHPDVSDIQ